MTPPAAAGRDRPGLVSLSEDGALALVAVRGVIDAALTPALSDVLGWAVDHHDGVVVDLSEAVTIDRSGLTLLLRFQDRAHRRGSPLRFARPSSSLLSAVQNLRQPTCSQAHCYDETGAVFGQ